MTNGEAYNPDYPSVYMPVTGSYGANDTSVQWPKNLISEMGYDPYDQGLSGQTVMLGYLSQIWQQVLTGGFGESVAEKYFGEGYHELSAIEAPTGARVGAALVNITQMPTDSSAIYGYRPIIFAGYCGFGNQAGKVVTSRIGPYTFQAGVAKGDLARGRMQYINAERSIYFPDDKSQNGFWVRLKAGFRATVIIYNQGIEGGVEIVQTGPLGQLVGFNWDPLRGGYCPTGTEPYPLVNLTNGAIFACGAYSGP